MIAVIRPYCDADIDAVTVIWLDSWRSTGISSSATLEELRERWPTELAKGWVVDVAVHGSDITGFIAIHENCIEQLFIAPVFQGQRIGKLLLDHAKIKIPAGFHLTTARDSADAR
ncbi:MAG TPA: GNAT family N-acetyltransferase [Sphingobium sp.]|uniref:GNAT family N-acetyltransferase n=1 Tax=Sphingobium sp. TaxID=1912891 RepID=UPI002ED452A0